MPDLYAVIGNPIAHSKSPLIHAEFSRQTDQDMRYEALLVPLDGFSVAVEAFRKFGGKGMNVTIPFKLEACKISTRLTERAATSQAVNTLVFDDDEILGDNTDGIGLVRDISSNLDFMITGKRVLVMGAGGAARGVLLPLLEHQPKVLTIVNRTKQKALELYQRFFEYGFVIPAGYEDLPGHEFDIVINATSASLSNELPSLPPGIFAAESLAYDMMYGNGSTPFLKFARQQGATHLSDGIGMLVEQAAESFFLWRGLRPETEPVIAMLRPET
ncbi:MAG: shikimate dehydrogenase [Nitrosomonadaceae bacterium]